MGDVMAALLMVSGTVLMLVAAVGLVRMPDALCRGHAVAKAVSLGIALILMGLWVRLGSKTDGLKLLLAIVFQLLTIPVASHLMARAVYEEKRERETESREGREGLSDGEG